MIVALIPARAGSVGVPNKNIRTVKGVPLLARMVQTAKAVPSVNRVYVSTDSRDCAEIARLNRTEVLVRPPALAEDVPTELVLENAMKSIEQVMPVPDSLPDPYLLLQCTTPLTTWFDIENAIRRFHQNHCNSLVSVTKCRENPEWMFTKEKNHLASYQNMTEDLKGGWGVRQNFPDLYRPNGAIYIVDRKAFLETMSLFIPPIGYYEMPLSRSWEVDEEDDFRILEALA